MTDEDNKHLCQVCVWGRVSSARARLCVSEKRLITCMECGEAAAKKSTHCVVPMDKVAYMVITDAEMLKQLNPKRVR